MKKFNLIPMVFDHIDNIGIWWRGSKDKVLYVFYWNPLHIIEAWIKRGIYLGFLPFKTKHLG